MVTDTEKTLLQIKKQLKSWESDFVSENKRRPNKDDIAAAPSSVQDTYKQYAQLKHQLQKSGDIQKPGESQNFNEIQKPEEKLKLDDVPKNNEIQKVNEGAWGADLNKAAEAKLGSSKPNISKSKTKDNNSFMSKLGKRLLEKAAHTPTLKPSLPSWGIPRSYSEPRSSKYLDQFDLQSQKTSKFDAGKLDLNNSGSVFSTGNKIAEKENLLNKFSSEKPETSPEPKASFLSVLDSVSVRQKQTITPRHNHEDVVLPGFGSKRTDLMCKYKYVSQFDSSQPAVEVEEEIPNELWDDDDFVDTSRPFESVSITQHVDLDMECDKSTEGVIQNVNKTPQKVQSWSEINKPITTRRTYDDNSQHLSAVQSVKPALKTKTEPKRGLKRPSPIEPNDETGQKTKRLRIQEQTISKGRGRRRATRRESQEEDEEQWINSGVSEVGWKTEQPTMKLDDDKNQQTPEEEETVETKPKKSRATKAISNDNFVRLNMKVKKYKRKGQHMTGGKYKRMQWKQRMKDRSASYGDKCFKCGQPGHWANKCTGKAVPKVPEMSCGDITTGVDDNDFPSLRQAMSMSRGIKNNTKDVSMSQKTTASQKSSASQKPTNSQKVATKKDKEDFDEEDRPSESVLPVDDDDLDIEKDIYREGYSAPEAPPSTEPLYQLKPDGSLPEPTQDVLNALHMFGFDSFRPGQKQAVMRILCGSYDVVLYKLCHWFPRGPYLPDILVSPGNSTLVILSTGSGKSLVYQLAAYLYATQRKAITLVISPLVSLMEDQVTGLPPGVNGMCLHTNMTQSQRKKVIEQVTEGKVHFLLVSPEAMTSSSSANSLMGSAQLPPIAFACIDEAHCVSEWSHHFRPSYLRICKVLRENYGVHCMLGLTATATMVTAASVSQHLGIHDYKTSTIRDIPVPTNLLLSASRDEDKDQALLALLQGDRFSQCYSIIIYCTRRQQTDRIATLIRTCLKDIKNDQLQIPNETNKAKRQKGKSVSKKQASDGSWSAECYHAGMTAAARKRVQNAFMSSRLRVVVATVAFGMGVDKSDVRGIIHYSMPKSFESYVQEIGRAGRDGISSHCHVFLDHAGQDANELKRHIHSNTIDRFVIKKLVRKLFVPCKCREKYNSHHSQENDSDCDSYRRICPGHERAIPIEHTVQELDIKEEGIATLLCYLELHPQAWLINLQHVYATCTIQCYGGPQQLQAIANKCPPVAVAIARQQKKGASFAKSNTLEFPVVDVSDSMGWESGPVKRELKLLQWNMQGEGGIPGKTGVLVTLTDLAFHVRGYGDLSDDDIEEIVSFLTERVQTQERTELGQLDRLQKTLGGVSHKDVWMCADCLDIVRSDKLKTLLRDYFDEQPEIRDGQITMLSFAREYGAQDQGSMLEKVHCDNIDQVRSDIRQFINLYCDDHSLSGRVIARIFHGIPSPCFPANIWGRVRRFWRCHLDVDFNMLRRIATQEFINLR